MSNRSSPRARRLLVMGALALLGILVLIQFIPYGRDHTSHAATKPVRLATAAQREVFRSACQDCHSYRTRWLWYTNVAPVAWLAQSDVDGGRRHLNLSTWDRPQDELKDVVQVIEAGAMPPTKYWVSPYHWNAKLSATEKRQLVAGFRALYRSDPPPVGHERRDG